MDVSIFRRMKNKSETHEEHIHIIVKVCVILESSV